MNNFIENDGIITNGKWGIERRWRQGGYLETTIYFGNKIILDEFLASSLGGLRDLIEFVMKDMPGEFDPCSTEKIKSIIINEYIKNKIETDDKK